MFLTDGSVRRNSWTAGSLKAATSCLMFSVSFHRVPMVSCQANSSGAGGAKICLSMSMSAAR